MKYRKKPVIIEAWQFTNNEDALTITNGQTIPSLFLKLLQDSTRDYAYWVRQVDIERSSQVEVELEGLGVPKWVIDAYKQEKIDVCNNITLKVQTLEGDMEAHLGDYIIKGVHGELYPCKPNIFVETYELVEE